jgi:hypothetical protein
MSWFAISYSRNTLFFYEMQNYIMVFTRMFHWTPSQATLKQTISSLHILLSSILISPVPSLGLLSGLFFQVFQLKNLYEFIIALVFAKYLVKTTILVSASMLYLTKSTNQEASRYAALYAPVASSNPGTILSTLSRRPYSILITSTNRIMSS